MVRHIMETVSDVNDFNVWRMPFLLEANQAIILCSELVELRRNARLSTEGFLDCVLALLVSK